MQMAPLLNLIDDIYATALNPTLWPQMLTAVSNYIGASFMSVVPYSDPSAIFMSQGGEDAMKGYTEHWFKYDTMVKVGIAKKDFGGLVCDWSSIGLDEIGRDAFYQEFRRDKGIGFCLGRTFEPYPGDYKALGINLPLDRDYLSVDALEIIETVLSHVARAMAISARLAPPSALALGYGDIFEQISCGAALIDETGRVVLTNKHLDAMRIDGLKLSDSRLVCAYAGCQQAINRLLRDATSAAPASDRIDFALVKRPSGRRPLMARAIPVARNASNTFWLGTPPRMILLLVVDLAKDALVASEKGLRLLGLTNAEAKVASLVGCGSSPRQAALQLGTTEGTVRNQLKGVFLKLDLTKQADLVQLLNRISRIGAHNGSV